MKKSTVVGIILSLTVVTVIGVVLGVVLLTDDSTSADTVIVLEGNTLDSLHMKLGPIHPGEETDPYVVKLSATKGDTYSITLDFTPTGDIGLAKFVDIQISVEGTVVEKINLQELLDGKQIKFEHYFKEKSADIEIKYMMDINVTDEAQNTQAQFDILLTAAQ